MVLGDRVAFRLERRSLDFLADLFLYGHLGLTGNSDLVVWDRREVGEARSPFVCLVSVKNGDTDVSFRDPCLGRYANIGVEEVVGTEIGDSDMCVFRGSVLDDCVWTWTGRGEILVSQTTKN